MCNYANQQYHSLNQYQYFEYLMTIVRILLYVESEASGSWVKMVSFGIDCNIFWIISVYEEGIFIIVFHHPEPEMRGVCVLLPDIRDQRETEIGIE